MELLSAPREIWLFDTAKPGLVVDVTEAWPRRLDALRAHASQEAVAGGLTKPAIEFARQLGTRDRMAEGFVRLKIW